MVTMAKITSATASNHNPTARRLFQKEGAVLMRGF